MATASNADSTSDAGSPSRSGSAARAKSAPSAGSKSGSSTDSKSSPSSIADRLRTAARIIWWSFLALVVVYTLIPVVALWFGAVPFDPPPTASYFAFVGFVLVGAAAFIAAGIYDA